MKKFSRKYTIREYRLDYLFICLKKNVDQIINV